MARELRGYTLRATDGDIGSVDDFYFDDERWTVRYLVADTGGWLAGRKVLISPLALGEADWQEERLGVALTKEQVRDSPDIDTDKPVSRQHELEYNQYYGYPYYWGGPGLWGAYPYPRLSPAYAAEAGQPVATARQESGDAHLRSVKVVTGHRIRARDGEIGHVEDFIVDDEDWAIRWMVVDTGSWLLPGRKVLVSPQWITQVSWGRGQVDVDLDRATIERSPEFDPAMPVNRGYETRLYDYYGRPVYWR
jgi:uncharacterized protein YrrD